ncbi:exodeoxyribonuclease III [Leptolyngbya sp. FACHB-261]|uniref:exodeoxyribonuclease III n=1 Tax=Leptolyngbya sp. FACHB-261 TaxID=2692806 RepID=UPI0016865117|nr:exodeoxyribonuclease III [Leptolyngbya sp. FACHB-261]MBD2101417.1 exodeoxyribonuclease III [Leptolyngbya sp. FACHB-261]
MRIATWNVNSVRTRLAHVSQWLQANPVDVLCLQETKVVDADFPQASFAELGYQAYFCGQKSYNGVALLSRTPLTEVSTGFVPVLGESVPDELEVQKRVITGVLEGIRIVNLYVPNGSEIGSDKYQYKLRWLQTLRQYLQAFLPDQDLLICGDFNIALEDRDIHDPKNRSNHIMASDPERQALRAVLELGFADAFRKFTAEAGHFSWWDYRSGSFQRNRGWRIDHHYLTPNLYQRATACTIDVAPRKLEKPSDHTPVIVDIQ